MHSFWEKFIRAMDCRAYTMAMKELRNHGMYKEAQEIAELKSKLYDKHA